MNRSEYIEYELEENVKKREKLKSDYQEKEKEYQEAIKELEDSKIEGDIKERKQFLLTLQEKHRKEIYELKERQKLEREGALWDYNEAKTRKESLVANIKSEITSIQKELSEIKNKNSELNKEKSKLIKLNQLSVTSHAIVQYLDRAKGEDIKKIKKEIISLREDKDIEVQDHQVIDFLVEKGRINREEIENEIVPDRIKKIILSDELIGMSGTFKRKDGFRLVVKNSAIITFLPKESKPIKKGSFYGKRDKKKLRKMRL